MKELVKKSIVWFVVLGLFVSMSGGGTVVSAGQGDSGNGKSARYIEPAEWNPAQMKAYQFDSSDDYEKYFATGGIKYFNKKFNSPDHMVRIQIVDSGYFVLAAENADDSTMRLYDATKKRVLAKSTKDDDIEYTARVKAGDIFYVKMPSKIREITLVCAVIKESFGGMKAENTYYQAGTGNTTYHSFLVSGRSAVEITMSALEKNGGASYAFVEKYSGKQWRKIGGTVKLTPGSEEDDFVYGLQPGNYRLALKSGTKQLVAASYSKITVKKKVSYKKSKAKNIKFNDRTYNLYTKGEKAARWYKIATKSTKKRRELSFGKDTAAGGYKFTVYKKGKKKPIKIIKVKSNNDWKTLKLPKKKGTYYIKVSKLTRDTNGVYEIGYYYK